MRHHENNQVSHNEYDELLQQVVALLPWKHTLMLMDKFVDDDEAILYYAEEMTAKGWSRALLTNALNLEMHKHRALPEAPDNNFAATLPAVLSAYANDVMRSTYNLGFLGVTETVMELELERLSILDRTVRGEGENPSIGIILCAEKDHVDVELSLDSLQKPIGIADYRLVILQEELRKLVQKELENYINLYINQLCQQ